MTVHPNAQVHPEARIGDGTRIGPFCVIGPRVSIGAGCELASHVVVDGNTTLGDECRLFPFTTIGLEPQDLKYRGEETRLEIGRRNILREYVNVHAGTAGGGGVTRIGDDNFIMAYSHVAHDCQIGHSTLLANAATLAGHVTVADFATVGAFSGVHQFCRVGRYAYIGGYSVVTQDALPFVLTVGNRARTFGVNIIGLRRREFPAATLEALSDAYRRLFQKKRPMAEAIEEVAARHPGMPEVSELIEFIRTSERGVVR